MLNAIEVCKTCNGTGIEYDGAGHTCTACNGIAAPVVERQPFDKEKEMVLCKAEWMKQPDVGLFSDFTSGWLACLNNTRNELAELQATIARLTAENERLTRVEHQSREALQVANQHTMQVMAEIERLKAGQGEPVAVVAEETVNSLGFMMYDASGSKYTPPVSAVVRKAILLDPSLPDGTKLYTSQPAPVSVVLPERKPMPDQATFIGGNTYFCKMFDEARGYNQALDDVRNCLDKVKELNQ